MNTASEKIRIIEPRFRLTPFSELKLGIESPYLVKGLIPRTGLALVWGPPKCAKSFWMFDIAMHVALGWEYRGRRVRAGQVVYCAFEGSDGFRARAEAFRQRKLAEDHTAIDFHLVATRANLVTDHSDLVAAIRAQLGKPCLVVLDTLNRSLAGSESDDKDMAAYVKAADFIREAFGCAVAIVHHCGIDSSRPRGHTSLTGSVDAQLAVKRDTAGNIIVTVECMKDGPEGEVIVSALQVVTVGMDEDGEPISSCVIVPVDSATVRSSARRKLSDRQQLALKALIDCANESGRAPPPEFGLPAGLVAVPITDWRKEMFRCGALDREAKNPRADFQRVKQSLQARQLIGERDDLVWPVSNS